MTSNVVVDSLSTGKPNGGRNRGEDAPLKKGPWTKAEDMILKDYVAEYGPRKWSSVHRRTGLARSGKSCRLRWANYLRPDLKKGAFTPEEEELIIELHAQIGNKWVQIATEFPGRTDNDIKNFWNTRLRRQRCAEKYLDPPDVCSNEFSEDKQISKELVTSSSANPDPALLPINKSVEIPTVELKNVEPSQQLYPPALLNIGSTSFLDIPATSLLDQGFNASWNTRSVSSTVHPSKRIPGSETWSSNRNVDLSQPHQQCHNLTSDDHLSFCDDIPVNHAPLYGNSSSETMWEHKQVLSSHQTSMETWSLPSSIPSLESSYTLVQTPPNEYTELCSLSPQSHELLNAIFCDSQTSKASWNNLRQDTSRFVVPDSCPVLQEIQWGTNTAAIFPSGHSITSLFNKYTPNDGGPLEEQQSIAPLIGSDVDQGMVDFVPTGMTDHPLDFSEIKKLSFSGTDSYIAPTVWPRNRMGSEP